MQNFRDYYKILGVVPNSSPEAIKKAFRQQARRYHPDLNPGDKAAEEKFKAIGEAYEVLSDSTKRSRYDQYSRHWQQKPSNRKSVKVGRKSTEKDDFNQFPDFNSFVDDLLKEQQRPPSTNQTTTKSPRPNTNKNSAYRPGTTKTAYKVDANGRIPIQSRSRPRDVEAKLTLPLEKAYQGGRERIRLEDGRSLEVDMPNGMIDGQRVRLRNQGLDGGDLYLKISLANHSFFALQGADIYCQIPVTPSEAVLGAAIEVPTLDGLVRMNIPSGVKAGQVLRLANKGYPLDDGRGDQLVEIQIVIPTKISPEEEELYTKLREIEQFNPRFQLLEN